MKPLKVGITGGIGSGKSLICKIFYKLEIPIYDADTRAKWLTNNDPEIRQKVIAEFGDESFNENDLNREYLASRVFNNPEQLKKLNSIIHPAVAVDYESWVIQQDAPYTIKEAALMFESGSYKMQDLIIAVSAPKELRISRVLSRDSFRSRKQIEDIIDKQISEEERIERSDFVVYNDDSQLVIPQVIELHQKLIEKSKNR